MLGAAQYRLIVAQ